MCARKSPRRPSIAARDDAAISSDAQGFAWRSAMVPRSSTSQSCKRSSAPRSPTTSTCASPRSACWRLRAQVRITRSQEFSADHHRRHRRRRGLFLRRVRQLHQQPAGGRRPECLRLMDAGFLGPLSQADRGRARSDARSGLGAARRANEPCGAGSHNLHSTARPRPAA